MGSERSCWKDKELDKIMKIDLTDDEQKKYKVYRITEIVRHFNDMQKDCYNYLDSAYRMAKIIIGHDTYDEFEVKTGLSEAQYNKLIDCKTYDEGISKVTIVSLCVGYSVGYEVAKELLFKCGHVLCPFTRSDIACLSNMNASHLLSDEEIRAFAGHKDISTTQKCYFFATDSLTSRKDAYESAITSKMPKVFKGVHT